MTVVLVAVVVGVGGVGAVLGRGDGAVAVVLVAVVVGVGGVGAVLGYGDGSLAAVLGQRSRRCQIGRAHV